jgi:superfamily II DNA helicase RecQ
MAVSSVAVIEAMAASCLRVYFPRFGHELFVNQMRSIVAAIRGNTMVSLPTGAGKTIVMALISYVEAKLSGKGVVGVVITPLLSLIGAHISGLARNLDITGHHIKADMTVEEKTAIVASVQAGRCRLLFTCPEIFGSSACQKLLRVSLKAYSLMILVDEAHLAVEWGTASEGAIHDQPFRPAYAELGALVRAGERLVLLSGTFTAKVVAALRAKLFLDRAFSFICPSTMDRSNLYYSFHDYTHDKSKAVVEQLALLMGCFRRHPLDFPTTHIFCRSLVHLTWLFQMLRIAAPPEFRTRIAKYHASIATEQHRLTIVKTTG